MLDRNRAVKVVAGIMGICLLGTAVFLLGMRIHFGTVLNEPTTIVVQIDAPSQTSMNEPFVVIANLTNISSDRQILHSIDVETSYLENIGLSGSTPTYKTMRSLPLANFTSYQFEEEIPAGQTVAIELNFVGQTIGQFSGLIDICLADGTLCLARTLEAQVIE